MAIHTFRFRPLPFRLVVALPCPPPWGDPSKIYAQNLSLPPRFHSSPAKNLPPSSYASGLLSCSSRSLGSNSDGRSASLSPIQPHPPPHTRGRKEVQDRLTAMLIRKEIPDLKSMFTSPGLLPRFSLRNLLLVLLVQAAPGDLHLGLSPILILLLSLAVGGFFV